MRVGEQGWGEEPRPGADRLRGARLWPGGGGLAKRDCSAEARLTGVRMAAVRMAEVRLAEVRWAGAGHLARTQPGEEGLRPVGVARGGKKRSAEAVQVGAIDWVAADQPGEAH